MTALEQLDPLYHFNTRFPDRLNLIDTGVVQTSSPERKARKSAVSRRKNNPRYKTQPITFDEIKEVEEPAPTPTDDSAQKSFLSGLTENRDTTKRLTAGKYEQQMDLITGLDRPTSPTADRFWYDSEFPGKLSFLDVPEGHHHKSSSRAKPAERRGGGKSAARLARRRNNPRYKTQPITFDEIKEVEEPEATPTKETAPNSMDLLFSKDSKTTSK